MSIPDPTQPSAPSGWYPTGETGPDGLPVERWWDGSAWSAMVRPLGSGAAGAGGKKNSAFRGLIAAAVVVVLAGAGIGAYFAFDHSGNSGNTTASGGQPTPSTAPNGGLGNGNGGLGGGNGGNGNGDGNGGGGLGGGSSSASPQPTVTGGSGQSVSDPIDALTIPLPSGWTGSSGSSSGEGSFPTLSTGPYTCPSALAQSNGTSSSATCTSGGINFNLDQGSSAQSVATTDIATMAKANYGSLSSHKVLSQGAVTVAGRSGYQVTWSVVPSYDGPSGTVELIALPVPGQSGYYTLIDIGVDQTSKAPSLSTVNSQIISGITDSSAAGA